MKYDSDAWRPALHGASGGGRLVGLPGIYGTWEGRTVSDYIHKDHLARYDGVAPTYMTIEHGSAGLLRVTWHYRNGEASAEAIARDVGGVAQLFCLYAASEKTHQSREIPVRSTVERYPGSCSLTVYGTPEAPTAIAGPYFNARGTQGWLIFDRHVRRVAWDFPSCQGLFPPAKATAELELEQTMAVA